MSWRISFGSTHNVPKPPAPVTHGLGVLGSAGEDGSFLARRLRGVLGVVGERGSTCERRLRGVLGSSGKSSLGLVECEYLLQPHYHYTNPSSGECSRFDLRAKDRPSRPLSFCPVSSSTPKAKYVRLRCALYSSTGLGDLERIVSSEISESVGDPSRAMSSLELSATIMGRSLCNANYHARTKAKGSCLADDEEKSRIINKTMTYDRLRNPRSPNLVASVSGLPRLFDGGVKFKAGFTSHSRYLNSNTTQLPRRWRK
jgi:hypothetical protein